LRNKVDERVKFIVPLERRKTSAHVNQEMECEQKYSKRDESGESSSSESSSQDELLAELEDKLHVKLKKSEFEKTPMDFLPRDVFQQILPSLSSNRNNEDGSADHVLALILQSPNQATEDDRALANYIMKSAKTMFLIAIYIKLSPLHAAMALFRNNCYDDSKLPIEEWPKDQLTTHPLVVLEEKSNSKPKTKRRRIWSASSIDSFQKSQWIFLAPIISTETRNSNFGLRPMPFVARSTTPSSGAHGVVTKYTVHSAHFKDLQRPVIANTSQTLRYKLMGYCRARLQIA
jgi:hypothetical protein